MGQKRDWDLTRRRRNLPAPMPDELDRGLREVSERRFMLSRFDSKCYICGGKILKNTGIVYDSVLREAKHFPNCPEETTVKS
jgi:hypothetical protein